MDLDEELELGGGSFQVLRGVSRKTPSGSSCCPSDCRNCAASAFVGLSTDAFSRSDNSVLQNVLKKTECPHRISQIGIKKRKKKKKRGAFTNVGFRVFGFFHEDIKSAVMLNITHIQIKETHGYTFRLDRFLLFIKVTKYQHCNDSRVKQCLWRMCVLNVKVICIINVYMLLTNILGNI